MPGTSSGEPSILSRPEGIACQHLGFEQRYPLTIWSGPWYNSETKTGRLTPLLKRTEASEAIVVSGG